MHGHRRGGLGLRLAALLAGGVPATAHAQSATPAIEASAPSDSSSESRDSDRALRGHVHPFPALQSSAFVTTHFGIRQGFLLVSIPRIPLGGETLDLNASGLVEAADLGVKILPWLGLFGSIRGQVTMGTDVASIIVAGGSFALSGDVGAALRVFRSERRGTQGTFRLSGGLGTGRNVSVLALVGALATAPERAAPDVVGGKAGNYVLIPTGSRQGAGAFHLAQTLTRHLGLQLSVGGQYEHASAEPYDPQEDARVSQSVSGIGVTGAIAATLDGAASRVPVALVPEYALTLDAYRSEGATQPLAHVIGVGLYYSGTPTVQVGFAGITQLAVPPVDGVDATGNPAPSGKPSTYAGQFILRHVW